jgi:hypothetical protein
MAGKVSSREKSAVVKAWLSCLVDEKKVDARRKLAL